jgi:hypothetical protein
MDLRTTGLPERHAKRREYGGTLPGVLQFSADDVIEVNPYIFDEEEQSPPYKPTGRKLLIMDVGVCGGTATVKYIYEPVL